MAGISIHSAAVGISGGHIKSLNSHGVVPIKHGELRESDVANVLAAARRLHSGRHADFTCAPSIFYNRFSR